VRDADPIDYASRGMSIQAALLDQYRRFPDKQTRPRFILWNGLQVRTGDAIEVPRDGIVQAEFLHVKTDIEQGFDLKVDGWLRLEQGEQIDHLRTWYDPRYADTVAYPFHSRDGRLRVWNVFREHLPNGQVRESYWLGNAGFWVEEVSPTERIYHCSPGPLPEPDFEALVLRVRISPRP